MRCPTFAGREMNPWYQCHNLVLFQELRGFARRRHSAKVGIPPANYGLVGRR